MTISNFNDWFFVGWGEQNFLGVNVVSSVMSEILQARILEWVAILFSKDFPNPGIETVSYVSCIAIWETLSNHRAVYKSRLLLKTLLTAEADTYLGTPALHTAPRPHGFRRWIPASWGTSLTNYHGQT